VAVEPRYGLRYVAALTYAAELHANQYRKGTNIPYLAHLLAVSSSVWEAGGDEDQAIAGLLHDAVEDQGGAPTLESIRRRFGDRVAMIVDACTDADQIPKPPWRARKEEHISRIAEAPLEVLVVVAADKLHNARSIVADVRAEGVGIWDRFKAGHDGTLWYYKAMLAVLTERVPGCSLVPQLERVVAELAELPAS
jgi:(p)ppGpp synthase/HD superfamily hydrolase